MAWWYVGEALTVILVVPTLLYFLNKLLRPALEIRAYADDTLEHGVGLTGALDAVPKLVTTKELTSAALAGVARYGAALRGLM